jgi:hypothetical protein
MMKNPDQVLIDGLLENHVGLVFVFEVKENPRDFCHDYFYICLHGDFLPDFAQSVDSCETVAYHLRGELWGIEPIYWSYSFKMAVSRGGPPVNPPTSALGL